MASDGHESYALDMAKLFLHQGKLKNVQRVLDAIDDFIARYQGKLPRKPFYPIRQIKMLYYYLRTRILST